MSPRRCLIRLQMVPERGSPGLGCCHQHVWYPFRKAVAWEKFKRNLPGLASDKSGKRLAQCLLMWGRGVPLWSACLCITDFIISWGDQIPTTADLPSKGWEPHFSVILWSLPQGVRSLPIYQGLACPRRKSHVSLGVWPHIIHSTKLPWQYQQCGGYQ